MLQNLALSCKVGEEIFNTSHSTGFPWIFSFIVPYCRIRQWASSRFLIFPRLMHHFTLSIRLEPFLTRIDSSFVLSTYSRLPFSLKKCFTSAYHFEVLPLSAYSEVMRRNKRWILKRVWIPVLFLVHTEPFSYNRCFTCASLQGSSFLWL